MSHGKIEGFEVSALGRRRMPHLLTAVVAAVAIALAGCGSGAGQSGFPGHPTTGGSTTSKPRPPAPSVSITPAAGQRLVPTAPIVVRVSKGQLTTVSVHNAASGVAVSGVLSKDKTTWKSNEPLGYAATYQVKVAATGKGGRSATQSGTVHTLTPSAQADAQFVPGPGQSVGIGQPVVVRFTQPVTDRAAALKTLQVTSDPPQQGAWYWMSSTEVHFRPKDYWQPGTSVHVAVKDYGTDLGNGVYGAADHTEAFAVHDSWIAKADGASDTMRILHNGALVKTMPISLGKGKTPTHTGIHVISNKQPSVIMDSCSYGVCKGQPGYYKEKVLLDERISNDGEFVHAAPWSVGQQGSSNVSHGCVNLSPANAQWFYNHFGIGDVVQVTNSGGPPLPVWDTYGDWSLSWSQWQAGATS